MDLSANNYGELISGHKSLASKFCWNLIFSEIHRGRLTAGTYKSPMKRKEHDLNQTSMIMFQPLIFQGCMSFQQLPLRTMTSSFIQALQPQRRKKRVEHYNAVTLKVLPKIVEPNDHRLNNAQIRTFQAEFTQWSSRVSLYIWITNTSTQDHPRRPQYH